MGRYRYFHSPHPLSPSPQGEGGIRIAGGHPQTLARGKSLWTLFPYCHCEAWSAAAILGMLGDWRCDGEIASLQSQRQLATPLLRLLRPERPTCRQTLWPLARIGVPAITCGCTPSFSYRTHCKLNTHCHAELVSASPY
jgi:hypothetical protein